MHRSLALITLIGGLCGLAWLSAEAYGSPATSIGIYGAAGAILVGAFILMGWADRTGDEV